MQLTKTIPCRIDTMTVIMLPNRSALIASVTSFTDNHSGLIGHIVARCVIRIVIEKMCFNR